MSKKLEQDLKLKEIKPSIVSQHCVVYKFKRDLCDAGYVGYTARHLHQRIAEHKYSAIGNASVNSKCALHPPPPGNCGALARLVSPRGGALANLVRPGGRAFANPGDNPEKFVDVFKGMFS